MQVLAVSTDQVLPSVSVIRARGLVAGERVVASIETSTLAGRLAAEQTAQANAYGNAKKRIEAMYASVVELGDNAGFMVKTPKGKWLALDINGNPIR